MILRYMVLLYLFSVSPFAISLASSEDNRSVDALLHDGRHVKVKLTAKRVSELKILDPFFGLPIRPRSEIVGTEVSIEFQHPDTNETIFWQGKPNYTPLLLDVVDKVPYLVITGESAKETESLYGCPELPYFYLRYESQFMGSKWLPVPVEKAPEALRKANLIQRGQSKESYVQEVIPRTYEEWNYVYKDARLNERKFWDCRPPRALLPQIVLPTATNVSPEILETIDYTPDRVMIGDDWSKFVFDQKREGQCKSLFRPTDPNDRMQGQRFTNDSTGNKPVPYSRTAQFDMGVRVICDEHVWFVTHQEEPGRIVVSKFDIKGDQVYRTFFTNPERMPGFVGYIRIPSVRSEDGYLHFDWLDFRDIKGEWHVKRWLKMRIQEPVPIGNVTHRTSAS